MVAVNRKLTRKLLDSREFPSEVRPYLSMSGTGEPCTRKRWYGFHFVSKQKTIPARTQRIFTVGNMFEKIAISELKSIGYEIYKIVDGQKIEMTGEIGELQEELIGFAGHEKGHPDGRVKGVIEAPKTEHLLEMKTMAQKYFLKLIKIGLQKENPGYYAQVQKYMGKMKLTRTLFIAINKNTSEYYVERIELDKNFAEDLDRNDTHIIMSVGPPAKHYIKGFYKCGSCNHNAVCHENEEPEKNCRTCDHADLEEGGKWSCSNRKAIKILTKGKRTKEGLTLSFERQKKGCTQWEKGWDL